MATNKPRFSVTFTDDSFKKIQKYQKKNNISTQSKAVARLVELAISDAEIDSKKDLDALESELNADYLPTAEQAHIKKYRLLDPYGKEAVDSVLDVEYRRCEAEKQEAERQARAAALQEQKNQMEAAEEIAPEVYPIPLYSLPMSAGTGEESRQEYPEDFLLRKRPPRGTSYIAPVSGDSMEPTYHDGDKLFIHACTEIRPGQVGVFFMDGKQWVKELGDGVLISHNSNYGPRVMREDTRCQGLVLGVCDESYFK